MAELFGTDGIRGKANHFPMTAEIAMAVGRAVTMWVQKQTNKKARICVGRDTRISGHMIEHALISGINSMGGDAYIIGIIPTPGVAYMTLSCGFDMGVVISASHNPYYDNGIKLFDSTGYKLLDSVETEIENIVLKNSFKDQLEAISLPGEVYPLPEAREKYLEFLLKSVSDDITLAGMKIILDCSNGATFQVAPELFTRMGANVEALCVHPDGKNINHGCGSEHTENLKKRVVDKGAHLGLAFDGDGDRLIAVDEKGNTISGDQIIAICATYLKKMGRLQNNLVVSTVMSNLGLGIALKEKQINHFTTQVGDRYVVEYMRSNGAVIGGEDSGHMIFLDHHTTGDGILTALQLIEALEKTGKTLSEAGKMMDIFPQTLLNVEVKSKPPIETNPKIQNAIEDVENQLGQKGRVLVRYSGTQPMCRVMIEGPTEKETQILSSKLAELIRLELG